MTMVESTQQSPTGRSTGKVLSIARLKNNINAQLDVSEKIFELVPKLAEIAEKPPQNSDLKNRLEDIMDELLSMGEKLTQVTQDTGDGLLELLREPKK